MMRFMTATALVLTLVTTGLAQEEKKLEKREIKTSFWHLQLTIDEEDTVSGTAVYLPAGSGSSIHSYEAKCKGVVEGENLKVALDGPKGLKLLEVARDRIKEIPTIGYKTLEELLEDLKAGSVHEMYAPLAKPRLYLLCCYFGGVSIPEGQEQDVIANIGNDVVVCGNELKCLLHKGRIYLYVPAGAHATFGIREGELSDLKPARRWFFKGCEPISEVLIPPPGTAGHGWIVHWTNQEGWTNTPTYATEKMVEDYEQLRKELGMEPGYFRGETGNEEAAIVRDNEVKPTKAPDLK